MLILDIIKKADMLSSIILIGSFLFIIIFLLLIAYHTAVLLFKR
jgi:hypothetical protein